MQTEIDYTAIGLRIRSARLAKKMTQEALSNAIDCAPTYISSIENGHTKLSLPALITIAQTLDTTVDSLLYDNIPILVAQYDADVKDILRDCTPDEKKMLIELMRTNKSALRGCNMK